MIFLPRTNIDNSNSTTWKKNEIEIMLPCFCCPIFYWDWCEYKWSRIPLTKLFPNTCNSDYEGGDPFISTVPTSSCILLDCCVHPDSLGRKFGKHPGDPRQESQHMWSAIRGSRSMRPRKFSSCKKLYTGSTGWLGQLKRLRWPMMIQEGSYF